MKNKNLLVSGLIIIVAIAAFIFVYRQHVSAPDVAPADASTSADAPVDASQSTAQDLKVSFQCDDNKSMAADFNLTGTQDVALTLSDGRTMTLEHSSSSTQSEYASPDGSIVFYSNSAGTDLQEGNVATYSNCQLENNAAGAPTAAQ